MTDKLPPKILVIEPDEILNATLCNTIERYWFDVNRAKNANMAIRLAEVDPPNIAIISSRLQDQSAIEMAVQLRKIRELNKLPIIFLIEKEELIENYNFSNENINLLCRPFTSADIMTLIRDVLKRSNPVFQDKIIKFDDISMDLSNYQVYRKNKKISLGPTEFKILQLFVHRPKNIYSRRQIIDYVWGADKEISDRTIDVHINRLRKLMKLDTDRYQLIKTIRSAGYCLD